MVTGGAQGIGFGIAARLAAGGARLMLWDRDAGALEAARQSLAEHADVHTQVVNVTDSVRVADAAADAAATLGGVDILVHSAGIAGPSLPMVDYPEDKWREVCEVNLVGTYLVNREIVKLMSAAGYGRIVNIASIAGKEGNPNQTAYSASKAGVIGLTKSLGKELARLNISVNCITPAVANTRILEQVSKEHLDYMMKKIPRERFLEVDEIASMVGWLVSAENSFTTGAVFDLSGGRATY